jgi:hypothetical protein
MTTKIKIIKTVPFFEEADSLQSRLRRVGLRGFPDVHVYERAVITPRALQPEDITRSVYISQPHVRQAYLDRIFELGALFEKEGVDIYHLENAYDYIAFDEDNEATEWTMIPPVVEVFKIPRHSKGGFDYEPLLGNELNAEMQTNGWMINPKTTTADYHNQTDTFHLINDGAHRVHAGLASGKGITVLEISDMAVGFPYYAAPQSYELVQVTPNLEEDVDLKIHVLTSPGQKSLYRNFPSGGILTGSVRPAVEGEVFA